MLVLPNLLKYNKPTQLPIISPNDTPKINKFEGDYLVISGVRDFAAFQYMRLPDNLKENTWYTYGFFGEMDGLGNMYAGSGYTRLTETGKGIVCTKWILKPSQQYIHVQAPGDCILKIKKFFVVEGEILPDLIVDNVDIPTFNLYGGGTRNSSPFKFKGGGLC